MNELSISSLLLEHLIELQRVTGEKKTWKDLAEAIGMDSVYLNKIYNKRRKAGPKTVELFANYFSDPRFYDAAEMDRPEPLTQFILRTLPKAPEEIQRKIAEELSPYTTDPIPDGEAGQSDQS